MKPGDPITVIMFGPARGEVFHGEVTTDWSAASFGFRIRDKISIDGTFHLVAMTGILRLIDEGLAWVHGHDHDAAVALRAAFVLSQLAPQPTFFND